jgi:hypothetical protein
MKYLALATLLLATAASAAPPAEDAATGPGVLPAGSLNSALQACVLGNEPQSYDGLYVGNHAGPESYAILIDPAACSTCALGVRLEMVYFLLQLQAGASYQLAIDVADAIDTGGGCYTPGAVQISLPANNIPSNGFGGGWIISIPWNSACLDPELPYFLILKFPAAGTGVVGPWIDTDGVTPCRGWRNTGSGWVDLATAGYAGDIFIWADAGCCTGPVGTEDTSWGGVKSLFR